MVDGLIVVEVLKTLSGRNRPDSEQDKGKFFSGGRSFPSGHAMASWSLASVISHGVFPYEVGTCGGLWIGCCCECLPICRAETLRVAYRFGRFDGFIGWYVYWYVYKTHQDHSIHHHAWTRPQIMPRLDPGNREFGLTLQFGN